MIKIVVMASFNMDLVMRAERQPRPGETLQGAFSMFLGGKGFNQAVAARRLGADVAVIGRIGDDQFGAAFIEALDREGIERSGVSVDAERGTGVASVVVDAAGENAILQSPRANRTLTATRVREAAGALAGASAALFQLEMDSDGCREFATLARRAGARVVFNPAPATGEGAALLPLADLVVVNEIEAAALVGGELAPTNDPMETVARMAAPGRDVVLTLGAGGTGAIIDGERMRVPAFAVHVVDTVGAGDAFCAALTVRLAEGAPAEEALRFAAAAGAIACTRHGAEPSMPRRGEVESLLSGRAAT
jgi:ribokinase